MNGAHSKLSLPALLCFSGLVILSACSQADVPGEVRSATPFVNLGPDHPAVGFQNLIRKVGKWVGEGDPVGSELFISKDNKPIFRQSWGYLDRESRTPWAKDTICRIRSLSKPLLATAILLCHDRGLLALDDPIEAYLPEFDEERWGRFTIERLLSETASLVYKGNLLPIGSYKSLAELVLDVAQRGPAPSGTNRKRHPGTNYNILGLVLERVSGVPADEFMQTQIFKPLGMVNSYCDYRTKAPWRDRLASTYERTASGLGFKRDLDNSRNSQPRYFAPFDGVFSTVSDYAR
ncbi:MAG: CubicO group peptidase (beta-lactamase class C family), partial [Planctomycetota bacterium]